MNMEEYAKYLLQIKEQYKPTTTRRTLKPKQPKPKLTRKTFSKK